jgi:hypothetical protein
MDNPPAEYLWHDGPFPPGLPVTQALPPRTMAAWTKGPARYMIRIDGHLGATRPWTGPNLYNWSRPIPLLV